MKTSMAQQAPTNRSLTNDMRSYFTGKFNSWRKLYPGGVNTIRDDFCPDQRVPRGGRPTQVQSKYKSNLQILNKDTEESRELKNHMVEEAKKYTQFLINFTHPGVRHMDQVRDVRLNPGDWPNRFRQHDYCHLKKGHNEKVPCSNLPRGLYLQKFPNGEIKPKNFIPLLYHIIYDFGLVENILGKRYTWITPREMSKYGENDIKYYVTGLTMKTQSGQLSPQQAIQKMKEVIDILDYAIYLREFDALYCPPQKVTNVHGIDFINILKMARGFAMDSKRSLESW